LDDYIVGPTGDYVAQPNAILDAEDIDVRFSRNIFAWLNNEDLRTLYPDPTTGIDCTFNSFPNCGSTIGEPDYNRFRYNNPNQTWTTSITPKNDDSFYFYFGLNAASTAISKLRERYFAPCPVISTPNFTIVGTVTHNTGILGVAPDPFTGAINVTVIGGQGPYTYFWTGPNGYSETILGESNENGDIEVLDGGLYTVTVVDSGGVSSTTTFVVNNPQPLTCNLTGVNLSLDSFGNITPNGQLNMVAQGGMNPYDFTWENLDDGLTGVVNGSISGIETVLNLPAGITAGEYEMTVTDATGNTCTSTVNVLEPLPLSFTLLSTDTTCPQIANGTITVVATGGTQPYSYSVESLNGGMTMPDGSLEYYSGTTFYNNNLGYGVFEITVTDSSAPPITVGPQTIIVAEGTLPTMIATFVNNDPTSGGIIMTVTNPDPNPPNPNFPPAPQFLDLTFTFYVNGTPYTNETSPFEITGLVPDDYEISFAYQGCQSDTWYGEVLPP